MRVRRSGYRHDLSRQVEPALGSEEAEELRSARPDERLGELADLQEVLSALTAVFGFSTEQVALAAQSKRAARGGFERRLWLDEVISPT
jgi:predicted house-cleaning noncanonical NTP pyrophosphatase (MazG superfamily)